MSKSILDSILFNKKSILFVAILFICTSAFSSINVITPLPTNLTKCQGDTIIFSLSVTSDSTLEYVWKRNGTSIGSNSPILTISNISISDTGTYTCEIKELNTSNINVQTCKVLVNLKPVILTQPTGGISPLCEGSSINLSADVQNATMVWKRNGTVLSTGTPSYSKSNISIADTGNYFVLGKALPGCVDVTTNSFNQSIRRRGVITKQPVGALLRDQANMSYVMKVEVSGDGPFAYQWYKNGNPEPGANSDSFKIYSFTTAGDSASYRVIVNTTIPCNDTLTSSLALVQPTLCPIIISQPDTLVYGCMKGVLNLEIKAVGVGRYQWFKNGTDSIPYASFPRYTVVNLDSTAANFYTCVTYREAGADPTCNEKSFKRVRVDIKPRPAITLQPLSNVSCHATNHTMKVAAKNTTSYQWFKNNAPIVGASDSMYTVASVTMTPDEYMVHAQNPYCTPEPSNKVTVRQVNPQTMVSVNYSNNYDLLEQCTDSMGWSYYAHAGNIQQMLFAIKKNGNTATFSPDVTTTKGLIKELQPATYEQKGILMGLRLFNIKIGANDSIVKPYDVKFYFDKSPSGDAESFISTIRTRKNNFINQFSTELPTDELSFITSTQQKMDSLLLFSQTSFPLNFNNTIVTNKTFGTENGFGYVAINNLVASKGGGTFYFHYNKKASSGISSINSGNLEIFPNPSFGNVTLIFKEATKDNTTISMYDIMGREVQTNAITKFTKSQNIDYSQLPAGNYILKVDNGLEQTTRKLTIEK